MRPEQFVNYFPYDYARPESKAEPFRVGVTVLPAPWKAGAQLLHIGVKGFEIPAAERPPANLVLLIDVSGSMSPADRLPLLLKGAPRNPRAAKAHALLAGWNRFMLSSRPEPLIYSAWIWELQRGILGDELGDELMSSMAVSSTLIAALDPDCVVSDCALPVARLATAIPAVLASPMVKFSSFAESPVSKFAPTWNCTDPAPVPSRSLIVLNCVEAAMRSTSERSWFTSS